jgi:hypothetical protein
MPTTEERLKKKLRNLNETIWERRAGMGQIQLWLDNFKDDINISPSERMHALYILARFTFFSEIQIKELLKSLYRDLYKYPIISSIRKAHNDTTDTNIIKPDFDEELRKTRFIAMGGASESGQHLLYLFRIVNDLPIELFIMQSQIVITTFTPSGELHSLRDPSVNKYIFIDDFCGSGSQAITYSKSIAWLIRKIDPSIDIYYYVLVATEDAIKNIKRDTDFSDVKCVYTLDNSYKFFGDNTRYFVEKYQGIEKEFAKTMCRNYGNDIWRDYPLGWKDGQLAIGFHHNTPDNTLPIIWYEGPNIPTWKPIFKRAIKH